MSAAVWMPLLAPMLLTGAAAAALARRQDVYALMTEGAGEGLRTVGRVMPALVVLLAGVEMLRASGAMDLLAQWLAPLCARVGIPAACLPLALVRPFSGSAALGLGAGLIAAYGPDSLEGRTAAVMLGSTETTFYAVSVYFGAAGVRRSRYTVPAALIADLTGFVAAALWTRLLG